MQPDSLRVKQFGGIAATEIRAFEQLSFGKAVSGEFYHLVRQIQATHLVIRPDSFGRPHQAVSRAETNFRNLLSSLGIQRIQSGLANGRFTMNGKQVIDAADFVVERLRLVFRLKTRRIDE